MSRQMFQFCTLAAIGWPEVRICLVQLKVARALTSEQGFAG